MALSADPIHYHTIRRNSGGRRKLIYVTNSDNVDLTLAVRDLEKPEWVEIEGIYPGAEVTLERGKRTPFVVNVNTEHQYFPHERCMDERARVIFDERRALDVAILLPKIVDDILPFRGVFAIDFGTTNSVYSFKGKAMDMPHHARASQAALASAEIPSAVFFSNVADRKSPRFSIGREALHDIKENSGRTYSYMISAKRMLGLNRSYLILDRMSGSRVEHRQEYRIEEVASFIMRELLERAQDEIGQKIMSVVATYPPMFAKAQKDALANAFRMAMEAIGIGVSDETLIMDLDEANAGAFNYIYGPILDEFRNFEVTDREVELLSMDFGGGTVDIALVAVKVVRNQQGRIAIDTELKGLSGESNWGGDNVTLDVFKMLKPAVSLAAAEARAAELEKKQSQTAADDGDWGGLGAGPEGNIWDTEGEGAGGGGGGGIWDTEEEGQGEKKGGLGDDPDVAEIENREPPENYEAALITLAKEKELVRAMAGQNRPILELVVEAEKADGSYVGEEQSQQRSTLIESALETAVPTQFDRHRDVDPFKMEMARNLFHELWHEADLLKIRMSSAVSGKSKVTGVLKKVAKYAGVDPLVFNDIEFELSGLDTRVGPIIARIVDKAKHLYEGVQGTEVAGLMVRGQKSARPPLRVLLLGNCANMPIIQKQINEAFAAKGQTVIFDSKNLKRAVACGAVEEYSLRKEFGERGLITYSPKGFLDRLPYALGIQHRELALMKYPKGFCPIFERNTEVGAVNILDENSAFLIQPKMTELAIFADYKDGSDPVYVGWIDFTAPITEDQIPPRTSPEEGRAVPEPTAPDGAFAVRFELLGNRELLATSLQTGTYHVLQPEAQQREETEAWDKERDPFSGVH